ncbi:MAG TPA: SLC13 family permease [Solirubrobacteraceae bacterium]|nr:SLC13 family permease [Solirubrobacteraceae bacterium]
MPEALALVLAVGALAVTLGLAIAQPHRLAEATAAVSGAVVLVAAGALSTHEARHALGQLAPTIAFLAALLLLAEGCRREGLFDAFGGIMARDSRGRPRRLLAVVFVLATAVTAVLGLDPTVVLLTPVVLVTATRLRMRTRPPLYACSHLANSASLLLPVSNLTNLLAFHALKLSFTRFAALMALPTAAAVAIEWGVLSRYFAADLESPGDQPRSAELRPLPRFALAVLGATLAGFVISSPLGIEPLWIAIAGATAITLPGLARQTVPPRAVLGAVQLPFLVFVLGLGVIVAAAGANGLTRAVHDLLPAGSSLAALLGVAFLAAALANLVNNLPAILILVPVLAPAGTAPLLAALVGVNVGPNLTYVGSLATLLWRRILRAGGTEVELGEFVRLGAATVPAILLASTALLWAGIEAGL